jgi:hypothetical protein
MTINLTEKDGVVHGFGGGYGDGNGDGNGGYGDGSGYGNGHGDGGLKYSLTHIRVGMVVAPRKAGDGDEDGDGGNE